jgi:hypothetical protein
MTLADTPENQAEYPQSKRQKAGLALAHNFKGQGGARSPFGRPLGFFIQFGKNVVRPGICLEKSDNLVRTHFSQ